jgi:hypothetical protein
MFVGLHSGVAAALIVSLSGVVDRDLAGCAEFADELDSRLVPASWLLPPRPRDGRHRPDGPVIAWLRRRIGTDGGARGRLGDALVQHGFDHTVDPIGRWATGSVVRIGRRAEFSVLPSHEAALRLIAASRSLDELGLRTDVFAPPRWLASAGTVVALRERGFGVCADGSGVRLLGVTAAADQVLRGRVLSLGAPPAETAEAAWRHRVLVASATRTARRGGLVRIAARADELRRPATRQTLLDAVDAALAAGARPTTYRVPVPAVTPLSA